MIRPAITGDAPSIQKLVLQLGYEISLSDVEDNIRFYQQPEQLVLVATNGNDIIGFITGAFLPMFHIKEKMCRITALCVDELQRSKGIGKGLVHALEKWCEENKCYYIEVTSGHHRENEAHKFYEYLEYKAYEGKRFLKRLTRTII